MTYVLWIGSGLGLAIGLWHAAHLYRTHLQRAAAGGAGSRANGHGAAIYRGLWTVALWTLFGSYLLIFWVIGAAAFAIARALPRRGAA